MGPADATRQAGPAQARRYVALALGCAALLLAGSAALTLGTLALGRSPLPYQALLDYQAAKLDGPAADTVFIGDSSLGHAIDAGLWTRLSGRRAVNLALTGVYGYEGGYNFLLRSLEKLRPRNVILMYAPDMMTRPLMEESFQMTRDPRTVPLWQRAGDQARRVLNFAGLAEAARWLWHEAVTPIARRPAGARNRIEGDYMMQGNARRPPGGVLTAAEINLEKLKYHRMIGAVCRRERLNCLYLHGPLESPKCEQSSAYFERVAELLAPSGMRLVTVMPACLPPDAVGDAEDHVRPELKPAATRGYYELVRPLLAK
jgi:hypothetical protein